jgi:dethiobiotin synthetase
MVVEDHHQMIAVVGMAVAVVVGVGVGLASHAILNFEVCLGNIYFLVKNS